MAKCCSCSAPGKSGGGNYVKGLPLICLVPRDTSHSHDVHSTSGGDKGKAGAFAETTGSNFEFLSDDYIKKHFNLAPRAIYLDPFRRPLISLPETTDNKHFSKYKKSKINQMILDGLLDPSEAIMAPSVFPFPSSQEQRSDKKKEEDDEIIYLLQLPDLETVCPVHHEVIRTPRFIWHSCKKGDLKKAGKGGAKRGGGALSRPKPEILSRITDFDLMSQW